MSKDVNSENPKRICEREQSNSMGTLSQASQEEGAETIIIYPNVESRVLG